MGLRVLLNPTRSSVIAHERNSALGRNGQALILPLNSAVGWGLPRQKVPLVGQLR